MKIQVVQIGDRGGAKERLHLIALADTNLVYYAVLATRWVTPAALDPRPRYSHWFTDRPVKAGDNILLCTGVGIDSVQPRPDGKTNHFVYWGLPAPIFVLPDQCAVVLEIVEWGATPFGR